MADKRTVTVYDATVTPKAAPKYEAALREQFGKRARITVARIAGSKPARSRVVVQVPE